MKINQINNFPTHNLSFQRKPTEYEQKQGNQAIIEGLQILGKEQFTLITHTAPLPNQTGIGTPYSIGEIGNFYNLIKNLGFNSLQLDPMQGRDQSPYSPTTSTLNEYLIPLDALVEQVYYQKKLTII